MISLMRPSDAVPRWKMLMTHPSAMIGHVSCIMYVLNETNWPTLIEPSSFKVVVIPP